MKKKKGLQRDDHLQSQISQREGSCGLLGVLAQAYWHPQGVLSCLGAALIAENALLWADDTLMK